VQNTRKNCIQGVDVVLNQILSPDFHASVSFRLV